MDEQAVDVPTPEDSKPESGEPSQSGPPAGFGKGVNDYLNHYVTVSDAKAAVLLAVNFVIIQFFLKDHFVTALGLPFHWAAIGFLSLSALATTLAVFPRLPRGSNGVLFWEDIREKPSPKAYEADLSHIDGIGAERQYAQQNFYVSKVLHRKMRLIQWSIGLFIAGATFALVCAIW
jgi:hypothetical protein